MRAQRFGAAHAFLALALAAQACSPSSTPSDAGSSDPCAAHAACGACTGDPACGFCVVTGSCETRPHDDAGLADCPGASFVTEATSCPAPSAACGSWSDCSGCLSDPGCGWCGAAGACADGTVAGPTSGACASSWTWDVSMCPGGAPPGPCSGVPVDGRCTSTSEVTRCLVAADGADPMVVTETCAAGYACSVNGGVARCALVGACADGDTRCSAVDTLDTCTAGAYASMHCDNGCVVGAGGASCATMSTAGSVVVAGTLTFDERTPLADLSDWGPIAQAPARGFAISYFSGIIGTDLYDSAVTGPDGSFTLHGPATPGDSDAIVVSAFAFDQNGGVLFVASPGFDPGSTHGPYDPPTDATLWGWSFPMASYPADGHLNIAVDQFSAAANVFDELNAARVLALAAYPGQSAPRVVAWVQQDVAYRNIHAMYAPAQTTGLYGLQIASQLFVTATATESYWADSVLAHEMGHWVMQSFGHPPGEGGVHYFGLPTFPGLAWSEGWATWFASYVTGSSVYVDKQDTGMISFDIAARTYSDPTRTWHRPDPAMLLTQPIDENEVAAMLWTLSQQGAAPQPLFAALASPHMVTRPFKRGYFRHTFSAHGDGTFTDVITTMESAPFLADFLDALDCSGFSTSAIDTATMPTADYPYPSSMALCP